MAARSQAAEKAEKAGPKARKKAVKALPKVAKKQSTKKQTAQTNSDRAPLLPPALLTFLKSTAWRSVGAVLILAAIAILLALLSYDAADPTSNNLTNTDTQNWLGGIGANLADILMQTLALGSYLLILPLLVWGGKIVRLHWLPQFWLNLAAIPLALALLAVAISVIAPAPDFVNQNGYGGTLGQTLYALMVSLMGDVVVPYWVTGLVFLLLGLPAYAYSLAMVREEWRTVGALIMIVVRAFVAGVVFVGRAVGSFSGKVYALATSGRKDTFADDGYERVEPTAAKTPAEPSRSPVSIARPEAVALDPADKRVKERAKTKRGKREAQEAQKTLDFGERGKYQLPPLGLLSLPPARSLVTRLSNEALEQNARMLEGVLDDFGVQGEIKDVRPGPVVTLYELEPARGVKSARVIGLADDIARSMSAISARVAVVPGRNAIGIELPNEDRETVFLRELLASKDYEATKARLPMVLGKDIGGSAVVVDLASMPHLLMAGTTGSGKSVGINTMILSLLYHHSPETLRMIMVDPKMLELSIYEGIPHLLTPVVTEPGKAVVALKWAVREMEDRYRNMSKLGVRNLAAFNKRIVEAKANGEVLSREVQTGFDKETGEPVIESQEFDFEALPFIVVIIDEMADLMLVAGKDVEATVQRLAQMARAAGIHVIMATQRPSVDVITGTIKANFPTRISFQVTSKIDSRTILGEQGAEQLLGMGDMLFMAGGGKIQRVHGAFVSDTEVEDIVNHLKRQGAPDYLESVTMEPEEGFDSPFIPGPAQSEEDKANSLYDQAVAIVVRDKRASTSYIQRRLRIGYNKAATLIEDMEAQGVISAPNHKGQREILAPSHDEDI